MSSSGRVHAALAIYALFALAAWAWRAASGASVWHDGAPLGMTHAIALPLALSLGALAGALGALASRAVAVRTRWGRGLHGALRDALAGTAPRVSGALAVAAAVGEELLFRGALLPWLADAAGVALAVVVSSALFGLLHVPWSRALVPWTLTACAMGVVFAGLYLLTGEVLAPIAAHAVINHENLRFLYAYDPSAGRAVTTPTGARDPRGGPERRQRA